MEENSLRNRRDDERSTGSIQAKEPKTTSLQKEASPSPRRAPARAAAPAEPPISDWKHTSKPTLLGAGLLPSGP